MSEEQLKAFIAKAKDDQSIQDKLKAAADAEAVVVIAKETGFMISIDDLNNSELAEEELESAAGGTRTSIIPIPCNPTFGRRCRERRS
jgi:predicted ribosomally synthesized peptide with nif11-like leader